MGLEYIMTACFYSVKHPLQHKEKVTLISKQICITQMGKLSNSRKAASQVLKEKIGEMDGLKISLWYSAVDGVLLKYY